MDIASVIITFMLTRRVLTRSILDNRSEQRFPVAQLCFLVTPLEATLPRFSASVHSKGLTEKLSPLEATLTKKPGGPLYPERVRRGAASFIPSVFSEGPLVYPERNREAIIFRRRPVVAPVVVPLEPRCFSTGNAIYLFSLYIVIRLFPFKRGGVHPLPHSLLYAVLRFPALGQLHAGDRP